MYISPLSAYGDLWFTHNRRIYLKPSPPNVGGLAGNTSPRRRLSFPVSGYVNTQDLGARGEQAETAGKHVIRSRLTLENPSRLT